MSDLTDKVLSKLEKVKKSGAGWAALCPAHDDQKPSLSVSESEDGKVLLKCHAGCEIEDIVSALELEMKDLFPDSPSRTSRGMNIDKTYDYVDGDGKLLYQTVRLKPKDFRQRQPDGRGGWDWNLKGIDLVLYHLPEVSAADDLVFVCEGEKSADAVKGLGLVATTCPLGAGKWRPSYTEALTGKHVAVLPDNDDQGKDHAATVAHSVRSVAQRVKVVHLPGLTEKGDPYDWVQAGGTKEGLLELVAGTADAAAQAHYWDEKGPPAAHDYIKALNILGYEFRLNVCDDRVEVNGTPISDVMRSKIRSEMRDLNYRAVNVMEDAWIANALANSYHPVRDYLDKLEWDGQDHIGRLTSYFKDERGYFPAFFRRWAIGAVARAYEDRAQNRMLVLDGAQGIGKSHFVAWLVSPLDRPELFVEGPINPDDKDDKVRLISAWIWEVSELGSTTRRSDRESLKYFLSMQQVTVRKPYGRYDLVKPALSSFIGTVNNEAGFLDDPTGYRRFMSVHLTEVNWHYAEDVNPEQVWAHAKHLYDSGEDWHLSPFETVQARKANEEYEMDDILHDLFMRAYEVTGDPADVVSTVDIQHTLNDRRWSLHNPRAETMAIASMLKKIPGVEKDRPTEGERRERGYMGIRARVNRGRPEYPPT